MEEFFRDEYRYHAQPETRASFCSGGDYVGLEVYASRLLNDFYSNTDRVEVSIDGYRHGSGVVHFFMRTARLLVIWNSREWIS